MWTLDALYGTESFIHYSIQANFIYFVVVFDDDFVSGWQVGWLAGWSLNGSTFIFRSIFVI